MGHLPYLIRIAIAGENPAVRQDLRGKLEAEGIRVAGEAADVPAALRLARQLRPDAWMLGLDLLRHSESQVANDFSALLSAGKSVVMITAIEKAQVVDAFRIGAQGIVLKSSPPPLLATSIRQVVEGHYWVDSGILAILVQTLRELLLSANGGVSAGRYGLTPRELDIIGEIVGGRSNREVSREFAISERTVKHHLTNIFNKLGVSNRLALALFAVNHQLTASRSNGAARAGNGSARGKQAEHLTGQAVLPQARHLATQVSTRGPSGNGAKPRPAAWICPGK
jgi:DNA-binding NarL/FixJ family response regulator